MTNPTPHGQVPEALIDLIDAYAETRHRYGRIYNAKTEAARNAVIEALSEVQALSAAPAGWKLVPEDATEEMVRATDKVNFANADTDGTMHNVWNVMLAATPTPPAEQQATKETSGGFHVWRDISTAPKDGSRFVAIGYNYGLYSEGRHICVAQWFRGCWMETSDWNEASGLQHLTHWLPLPSPPDNAAELNDLDVSVSPQQAAPKAVPRQEAQEPYAYAVYFPDQPKVELVHELDDLIDDLTNRPHVVTKLYTSPQPAPAPLSDDTKRLNWLLWKLPGDALRYVVGELADTSSGSEFRAAIDAAIAAQGGKT